jgi:hypothetical protein
MLQTAVASLSHHHVYVNAFVLIELQLHNSTSSCKILLRCDFLQKAFQFHPFTNYFVLCASTIPSAHHCYFIFTSRKILAYVEIVCSARPPVGHACNPSYSGG